MSAVFSYISKKEAVLATDTICSFKPGPSDTKLIPRSFTSKAFFLPQFKSAFAITGTLQAGLCFFDYMVEHTYGIDIDSLVGIDLSQFRLILESNHEEFPTGTIYLIGYSLNDETFKGYKLIINPTENLGWELTPQENFMFKPYIEGWEEKLTVDPPRSSLQDFVIDLMKLQKIEDEKKSIGEQVGIGGEIVYSYFFIEQETNRFTVNTQILYRFQDYFAQHSKMGQ